jgi:acetyltransferase-like isoleucine patch superfamily enzyme
MLTNRLRMVFHGVTYGKGFYCCGSIFFRRAINANIVLGNYISINSHSIADPIGGDTRTMLIAGNNATLILHDNVSISNATIFASIRIEIGEHTCIGGGVKIYDTDFHSNQADERLESNKNVPCKPIYIGKRTFIGGHSIILKGVSIGDEAVIGAGSVVTKNVPAGEIWAGNPAKFIKKI